tara:strand:+ start:353 stop:565 length:213 start_codon:yes stop_codon:yes gene_type:complete
MSYSKTERWLSDYPLSVNEVHYDLNMALDALKQYREYGEEMRKIGRGFHPVTRDGFHIESVISRLEQHSE